MTTSPQVYSEFTAPRCTVGMQVLWYRNGLRDRTSVEVAYMLHNGVRTSTIHASTGRRVDAVRHIDDPKLQLNADQRETGAWDFTEDYKETLAFRERVTAKLAELDRQVNALIQSGIKGSAAPKEKVRKEPGAGQANLKAFHDLRRKAREMGIVVTPSMKRADIESAVEAASGQPQMEAVENS